MNLFTRKKKYKDIHPEEIFLDSENLPAFDRHQFEGRIERPISGKTFAVLGIVFVLIGILFVGRLWNLQIAYGQQYEKKSENNRLKNDVVFANRGQILDRNGLPLAWNDLNEKNEDFALR